MDKSAPDIVGCCAKSMITHSPHSSTDEPDPFCSTPNLWPPVTTTSSVVKRRAIPAPCGGRCSHLEGRVASRTSGSSRALGPVPTPPPPPVNGHPNNPFSRASTAESTAVLSCDPSTGPPPLATLEGAEHIPKSICHRTVLSDGSRTNEPDGLDHHKISPITTAGSTAASSSSPTSPTRQSSPEFERDGTILIFDWDDTLLPSTWLTQNQLTLDDNNQVPEGTRSSLDRMAELSRKTLEIAESLGTVIIVTNAEQGWIELSCKKFMPSLYDYLCRLSARTRYESETANCPFAWKQLAFHDEIYAHFSRCRPSVKKNVISLGDSTHERLAVISITRTLPSKDSLRTFGNINDLPPAPGLQRMLGECRTKSVKFIEQPNIEALIQEHELVGNVLADVVHHDDDLDLCIKSTSD